MISRLAAVALGALILIISSAGTQQAEASRSAAAPALVGPTPLSTGDFDGDGRDDLAIGVPREDVGPASDAGAVHVLYGSTAGLSAQRNQLWTQGSAGVPGALERSDGFGWATTTGDFDGDGFDDLAIGVPLEGYEFEKRTGNGCCIIVSSPGAGAVNILYGSRTGLTAARAQVFHQGTTGVKGEPEEGNFMGAALAAGDFDGDGRDELAIGAPGENRGAGAVHVLPGTSKGIRASGDQLWLQDTNDVDDTSERGDAFGAALAAANLGYSSKEAELVIGIPGEDVGGVEDAGAVAILHGQPGKSLTAKLVADRFLHQNTAAVDDVAERRDMFGAALAIGNFGRSAHNELAIGVPGEGIAAPRQGAVHVFYGTSFGVGTEGQQLWYQGEGRLQGVPKPAAEVGRSLVAANFNGVSQDDLAIGAPYSPWLNLTPGAGAVHVVYGGPAGLAASGSAALPSQVWTRANLPPPDPQLGSELFGFAVAAGTFGRSAASADLVASAPNAWSGKGFVRVLESGPVGLTSDGARWHQDIPTVADQAEAGDRFGGG